MTDFNIGILNSKSTYDDKKEYIEMFFSKYLPGGFIQQNSSGEILFWTKAQIVEMFEHIFVFDEDEDTFVSFVGKWRFDRDIRVVNKINFEPFGFSEHRHNSGLNLFCGFGKQFRYFETTLGQRNHSLQMYRQIGIHLFGGDENLYQLIELYFAKIIQKPRLSPRYCLAIVNSTQGVGKDTWFSVLSRLVGKEHSINSGNSQDFFGEHATGLLRKIVVIFNETEFSSLKKMESMMKMLVTSETWIFNPKGQKYLEVSNFVHPFIFTNKVTNCFFDASSGDRRNLVFTPTEYFTASKFDHAFWTAVNNQFNSDNFLSAVLDHYNKMDISNVDWKKWRLKCLTPVYFSIMETGYHPLIRYVETQILFIDIQFLGMQMEMDSINESIQKRSDLSFKFRIVDWRLKTLIENYIQSRGEKIKLNCYDLLTHIAKSHKTVIKIIEEKGHIFLEFNNKKLHKYVIQNWYSHRR